MVLLPLAPYPGASSPPATSTVCPGANCTDDTVSPGVLGFAVFCLLAIAVVFLVRSFRRHIAKVPPTFDQPDEPR